MITFVEPIFLWGWLVLILGSVASWYWRRYLLFTLSKFIDPKLQPRLLSPQNKHHIFFKDFLLFLGIGFVLTALARPQWGVHEVPNILRGQDIVIAFDISKSMLAQDISPSRLMRAKWKAQDFIKLLQGERAALIVFAGGAFLQSPFTKDYHALQMFLDSLQVDLLPALGTSLTRAIEMALQLFQNMNSDATPKMLLLITDGEDHSAEMANILKKAQQNNLKISILGVGTLAGSPIPEAGQGFLKNQKGEVVVSRLKEAELRQIAEQTGGRYFRVRTDDQDLQQIYQQIAGLRGEKMSQGQTRYEPIERFQWALFLALICLIASNLIFLIQNFVNKQNH